MVECETENFRYRKKKYRTYNIKLKTTTLVEKNNVVY